MAGQIYLNNDIFAGLYRQFEYQDTHKQMRNAGRRDSFLNGTLTTPSDLVQGLAAELCPRWPDWPPPQLERTTMKTAHTALAIALAAATLGGVSVAGSMKTPVSKEQRRPTNG